MISRLEMFFVIGLFTFSARAFASDKASVPTDSASSNTDTTPSTPLQQDPDNSQSANEGLRRWLDLNTLSFSFRDRNQFTGTGYHFFENGQERSLIDGAFKLDPEGKYTIHFHVSSGRTFNWAFSDVAAPDYLSRIPANFAFLTPAQLQNVFQAIAADPQGLPIVSALPSRGWEMYFRQLYFSARPIKEVAVEFGGLGIERGASSEATTYDEDGYISGERVRINDPRHLYVDQLVFTSAYEGDIFQPNFFTRAERLGQVNYRQVLAGKSWGSRLNGSMDYTYDKGTEIVREAVRIKAPELKVLDAARVEFYQRLNDTALEGQIFKAHQGAAVTLSKTFRKQFQLDGGYASIDRDYGVLTGSRLLAVAGFSMNGDAFLTGNRVFVRANWKIAPFINLFGYYTHEVNVPTSFIQLNKQSFNCGGTIDFKEILVKMHVL